MNRGYRFIKTAFFIGLFSMSAMFAWSQKIDDNEIKKNVRAIDNSLERLLQLEPKMFEYNKTRYKDLQLPSGKQYGFIAENFQSVFPDLVTYKNLSYSVGKNAFRTAKVKDISVESIIPVLVASIKEQQLEIEQLKNEVQELKSKQSTVLAP